MSTSALSKFARYPLLFGPSPIHPLERLSDHLGGARIWAKREDCNSALGQGGNKIRKLEYLVPDALAMSADTLVSIGGMQSNHTRQVAAVATRLGMKAVLIQYNEGHWPDPVHDKVGNILLSRIMGADIRLVRTESATGCRDSWHQALADIRAAGGTPYPIPPGASDHPLGGLGFANWAQELRQQERQLGVFFDTIIVCSVTGSTQAGMIAGFATQDRPRRVIGIDASAKPDQTRTQVAKIARATAKLLELGRDLREDEVTVLDGWAGNCYGVPVQSTVDAIRLVGALDGMIVDPVHEGKSMAALVDLVRTGQIPRNATVLYVHLGGQPALNAYSGTF
jgi:1-aminocyclopropane-1-carboxylate deaminase